MGGHEYVGSMDRKVQRAGPKARKASARASFSLFFYLFSSLLFSFANGSKTLRAPASHGAQKERTQASLHIISPSPLSLSFTDRTRQRAFGAQIG